MGATRKPRVSLRVKKANSGSKQFQPDGVASSTISFGREICRDFAAAEQREWLITNGIGGFASGTIAGSATRRYHGLLFAALHPPVGRTLLVGGLDEIVRLGDQTFELAAHRWLSGAVAPEGYQHIESFRLEGTIPVWTYRAGAARIEKRIWMRYAENTTVVRYTLLETASAIDLELKALVNYRDFHSVTQAGAPPNEWHMRVNPVEHGVQVVAFDGASPFYLKSRDATCDPQHVWYRDFLLPLERERGLKDHEDQLFVALFRSRLKKGQSLAILLSTNADAALDADRELEQAQHRQAQILADGGKLLRASAENSSSPACLPQLLFAADQFVAVRPLPGQTSGKTVIAGYHWFGDWGRDTMIALPGLALSTGRPEIAKEGLLAFSRFVDRGMLPNNFPDAGGVPEYNTIDATLWYFETVRQYFAATQDLATLKELFPVLADIIQAHLAGTRYNIQVDPADGLLYGGGPGAQLTWMDVKIGDWVVTPRTGKPVEVNALWINALESMIGLAGALRKPSTNYAEHAARARSGFARFWNPERNCCLDVLDAPGIGNDQSLRPNQIFAVSLSASLLTAEQQKAVVDSCTRELLTPFGLRSLAPGEPGYIGTYSGGPRERDAAYHQGTVWGWLLGPFVLAHYRVYHDRAAALNFLKPLAQSIDRYGLGTLAEIYDGDAPHQPRGCIAQAWTVAELLRSASFLLSQL
jgi:predicted glycogen debranching enzyme